MLLLLSPHFKGKINQRLFSRIKTSQFTLKNFPDTHFEEHSVFLLPSRSVDSENKELVSPFPFIFLSRNGLLYLLSINCKKLWYWLCKRPGKDARSIMGVMVYFTTNFTWIIKHFFFQYFCQHIVYFQNEHTDGKLCLSWVSCLLRQFADVLMMS